MKGTAHLTAEGEVKVCVARKGSEGINGHVNFRPGVGRLSPHQAIELMGDLCFSSPDYVVAVVSNVALNNALLKAPKFTLPVNVDDRGGVTWS